MAMPVTAETSLLCTDSGDPPSSPDGYDDFSDGGSCSEGDDDSNGLPVEADPTKEALICHVYTFMAKSINDYFLKVLPMLMGAHYLGDAKFVMALFAILTTATNTTNTRLKKVNLRIVAKRAGLLSRLCEESLDLLSSWRLLEAIIGWLQTFCGLTLAILIPTSVYASVASTTTKTDGKVPTDFEAGFWYFYGLMASLQLAIILFIWLKVRSGEAEKCVEVYRAIGADLWKSGKRMRGLSVLAVEAEGMFSTFVGASFIWTIVWTALLSNGASLNPQQLSDENHEDVRILSIACACLAVISLGINDISSIRGLVVGGERHGGENGPSFRNLGRKAPLALFDCTVYWMSMHVMLGTFYHRYVAQHPSNPGDPVDDPAWNGFLIFLNCLAVMRHAAFNWRPGKRPVLVPNDSFFDGMSDGHGRSGSSLGRSFRTMFSASNVRRGDDPSVEGTVMESLLPHGGSAHGDGYQPLPDDVDEVVGRGDLPQLSLLGTGHRSGRCRSEAQLPVANVQGLVEAVY